MKGKIKHAGIIGLSILLLVVGICLFVIYYNDGNSNNNSEGKLSTGEEEKSEPIKQVKTVIKAKPVVKSKAIQKDHEKETAEEIYKNRKFESNEEIKKEFGRLEIVYLYNGQHFTGYVVSIDEFYSMVTVDGFKKFPMKDVKIREIIN